MVVRRKSGSSSTTWEGIEGYVPDFIKKGDIKTKLNDTRSKQQQQLMSKEEFASKYGFVYGDAIDKAYQDANKAKFDEIDALTREARDNSLTDMAANQDNYLQTIREQRANAPQTGIMKGASMAQEMAGMFGAQQASGEAQTGYANTMGKLANERGTSAEEARINALKEKNSVANQMGVLGMEKYGYDVQDEASYLSYLGQENANIAAMLQASGVWNQAEGQNTRRKTSESSSYEDFTDNSAEVNAAAQRDVAKMNNQAQRGAFDSAYQSYINQGYDPSTATQMALGLTVGENQKTHSGGAGGQAYGVASPNQKPPATKPPAKPAGSGSYGGMNTWSPNSVSGAKKDWWEK